MDMPLERPIRLYKRRKRLPSTLGPIRPNCSSYTLQLSTGYVLDR